VCLIPDESEFLQFLFNVHALLGHDPVFGVVVFFVFEEVFYKIIGVHVLKYE